MDFQDYINRSTTQLQENDKPRGTKPVKPTLTDLEVAINMHDFLAGYTRTHSPLAMKIKSGAIRFVWYDEEEMQYAVSVFDNNGVSDHAVDFAATLESAKRSL